VFLKGAAAGRPGPVGSDRPVGVAERRRHAEELMEAPVVLATDSLTKRYGAVTAVAGVDLELHAGEILGLIGPNGAGKTTLFDVISGFAPASEGRVVLGGRDVTDLADWQRARLGLGRSFQDARLWPSLTVAESIAIALNAEAEIDAAVPAFLGIPQMAESEDELADQVAELIRFMGLGAFRNKFISELSTGSRRMVELACMVAHRPSVLLLDEPSSGIAQRETEALGPLLLRIREELSCSVLIIEHDMPLITSLADHLIGLDLGRVVAYGTPAEVLNDPHVIESYLGSALGVAGANGANDKVARPRRGGRR